ncbi:1-aminocyclopropane-1-carboxylate deaminase [Bacterioplanes sanyensis]|uniref:1-aminocyclopropane-1-carboxylate deaminase n=1 Tax=Bacterioplanes sanyensis TaxID=1249553 RepID=A0A222FPQ5_9GAMM|nr:pyridoxal-phosphate dependent enzyme [Bacterioplanes sanyensis]ASP40506.1 1-aminocyclopropane-1-carboxylate deaminase [Bacterioplanes sanyensis]
MTSPDGPHWLQPLTELLRQPPRVQSLNTNTDLLWLNSDHDTITGNKPWKLHGHLSRLAHKPSALLSFGGPYSNHLHALAACGQLLSLPTIAVVRGYADCALTPTLADCQRMGMELVFVDRNTYRQRHEADFLAQLQQRWSATLIPEGGSGPHGVEGCVPLAQWCAGYEQVWLAAGTGTTAEGIVTGLPEDTELVVVNVVADQGELLRRWSAQVPGRWRIVDDMHGGGFGKIPTALRQLIDRYDTQGIALDPVYTAKLLNAYEHYGEADKTTLLIHTGGLQGRRGLSER